MRAATARARLMAARSKDFLVFALQPPSCSPQSFTFLAWAADSLAEWHLTLGKLASCHRSKSLVCPLMGSLWRPWIHQQQSSSGSYRDPRWAGVIRLAKPMSSQAVLISSTLSVTPRRGTAKMYASLLRGTPMIR